MTISDSRERAGFAPERLKAFSSGEAATLAEFLAVDHAALMRAAVPTWRPVAWRSWRRSPGAGSDAA